jgi:hypothetical protein
MLACFTAVPVPPLAASSAKTLHAIDGMPAE